MNVRHIVDRNKPRDQLSIDRGAVAAAEIEEVVLGHEIAVHVVDRTTADMLPVKGEERSGE